MLGRPGVLWAQLGSCWTTLSLIAWPSLRRPSEGGWSEGGKVARDCGAEVCEGVNTVKILVVDGDRGWGFDFLAHDVGLLNADGKGELLTSM